MNFGLRLRELREAKKLSQGDMEIRTGLLRCYISRVENGHTVPALETIEKLARALEMPLYQILYDGTEPPGVWALAKTRSSEDLWGVSGKEQLYLRKLQICLSRMTKEDRAILMVVGQKFALRNRSKQTLEKNVK
jgi:transcriptional regulator with XRE-family HTH domain